MPRLTQAQMLVPPTASSGHNSSTRIVGSMPGGCFAVRQAGTYYMSTAGILKPGQLNMGVMIQPHGFSVTPAFTLAPWEMVCDDPDAVPWHLVAPVTSGVIFNSGNVVPSAIRVVTNASGRLFVFAC